jgi:hypothetical protein
MRYLNVQLADMAKAGIQSWSGMCYARSERFIMDAEKKPPEIAATSYRKDPEH